MLTIHVLVGSIIAHNNIYIQVSRKDFKIEKELAEKTEMLVRCVDEGEGDGEGEGGVRKVPVEEEKVKQPALNDSAAVEIAKLLVSLEEWFGKPQDFEWGIEEGMLIIYIYGKYFITHFFPYSLSLPFPLPLLSSGKLYCLQARPIVTLPPSSFFTASVPGNHATLWDNSNIVESFAGVTSPLTFSFASRAYKEVSVKMAEFFLPPGN